MKDQGVVKHIGASSHTPSVIQEILDTDLIDMLMFSANPAYDYNHGDYAYGGVDERADVYKRCEKIGVGKAMKKYLLMIWSAIKQFYKEMGTPYEMREREPLTEEEIDELRKILERGLAEKATKS